VISIKLAPNFACIILSCSALIFLISINLAPSFARIILSCSTLTFLISIKLAPSFARIIQSCSALPFLISFSWPPTLLASSYHVLQLHVQYLATNKLQVISSVCSFCQLRYHTCAYHTSTHIGFRTSLQPSFVFLICLVEECYSSQYQRGSLSLFNVGTGFTLPA